MERFWKKVTKTDTCWNWTSHKDRYGYGRITVKGKSVLAHRLSFELKNGKLPEGKMVLHTCDNRGCVNPLHLYTGTARQNTDDMMSRKRNKFVAHRGQKNGRSKLSDEEVGMIRTLYATGQYTQAYLAEFFGVGAPHLSRIVNGHKRSI